MDKISIIGSGSWATALSTVLTDNGIEILMWSPFADQVEEINVGHTNKRYFPDIVLDKKIKATTSLEDVVNFSDNLLMVIPTNYYRETLKKINNIINRKKVFINASKGIEPGTFLPISEMIKEEIDDNKLDDIVILSGPSHAEEVVLRKLTLITSVCENEKIAEEVQKTFSNDYLRVYIHNDVLGVEIASSLKNVIALASGIAHGMGYGDNTRAALITRGLVEIMRYGEIYGCNPNTFYGLAGIGDLIVTATSFHSRNFQAGMKIADGESIDDIVNRSSQVVEGIRTAKAVYEQLSTLGIEMPILEAVYKVVYDREDPKEVINNLMNRELKREYQSNNVMQKN